MKYPGSAPLGASKLTVVATATLTMFLHGCGGGGGGGKSDVPAPPPPPTTTTTSPPPPPASPPPTGAGTDQPTQAGLDALKQKLVHVEAESMAAVDRPELVAEMALFTAVRTPAPTVWSDAVLAQAQAKARYGVATMRARTMGSTLQVQQHYLELALQALGGTRDAARMVNAAWVKLLGTDLMTATDVSIEAAWSGSAGISQRETIRAFYEACSSASAACDTVMAKTLPVARTASFDAFCASNSASASCPGLKRVTLATTATAAKAEVTSTATTVQKAAQQCASGSRECDPGKDPSKRSKDAKSLESAFGGIAEVGDFLHVFGANEVKITKAVGAQSAAVYDGTIKLYENIKALSEVKLDSVLSFVAWRDRLFQKRRQQRRERGDPRNRRLGTRGP